MPERTFKSRITDRIAFGLNSLSNSIPRNPSANQQRLPKVSLTDRFAFGINSFVNFLKGSPSYTPINTMREVNGLTTSNVAALRLAKMIPPNRFVQDGNQFQG